MGKDNRKVISPREVRAEYRKLYHKFLDRKGRNKLENRYLAKLRYMAFFLATMITCNKRLLDNWDMPDYRTVERIRDTEGEIDV